MSVDTTTYDVFLSYSLTEADVADLVQRTLAEAGLDVFNPATVGPGLDIPDLLWRALAESAAVVAIIHPQRAPVSSMTVELGAAMAWHKPIYVVHSAAGNAKLAGYLERFPAYPVSRIDDVAQSIRRSLKTLSEEERSVLADVYAAMRIPTQRLLREPLAAEELAREFNARARTSSSGERLVQELVRLRKAGALPRLHRG